MRTIFAVKPEFGVTVEDMLKPEYWTHVAQQLRPLCRIEAVAEDGSWFAEFMVISTSKLAANVSLMRHVLLSEVKPSADGDTHFAKWAGPSAKYRVVRKSDNAAIKDGFDTQAQALIWIAENIK